METDHIPPSYQDSESVILGSAMSERRSLDYILSVLKPEHFYLTSNQRIFMALSELKQPDIILLTNKLNELTLEISGLSENVTAFENLESHVKRLKESAHRRKIISESSLIMTAAYELDEPLKDIADKIESTYSKIVLDIDEESEIKDKAKIIDPVDLTESMMEFKNNGPRNPGVDTDWKQLSAIYRPALGTLNIINGIPSHGKSEFMDALAINISKNHKWKWCVFSPENYPTEIHIQKLIEKTSGNAIGDMLVSEIEEKINQLSENFRFVQLSENRHGLDDLLTLINKSVKAGEYNGLIIDPWNELDISTERDERETDYIGRSLSRLRRYGRRNNLAIFIVAHPAKMYKDKNATVYNVPTLYDLAGSAHWYNKADNGLTIYRNFDTDTIDVHVQKIKFKIHGSVGLVTMKYDRKSGRFEETFESPAAGWTDKL